MVIYEKVYVREQADGWWIRIRGIGTDNPVGPRLFTGPEVSGGPYPTESGATEAAAKIRSLLEERNARHRSRRSWRH